MSEHPNDLRSILLEIREKRGTLTPEVVLEEATDPMHPLHHRFEWDDSVAAHKYRLSQAGSMLRVKYRQSIGDEVRDLRAFWVAKPDDERDDAEYIPIEEVILNPVAKQLMLNQMRRDWLVFKRRYQAMSEFADIILAELTDGKETA